MTDYFALLGEARRPWLDPGKLKEKYFDLARERPADAELNEAYRVLSDPKLRLHHLLTLRGANLQAARDIPPALTELFWNTGNLLREIDRWRLKHESASSALSRALLCGERAGLMNRLTNLDSQLNAAYEAEIEQLRGLNPGHCPPDEIQELVRHHDALAYLSRLREQVREKRLEMTNDE
jgi:hypothetical protein